MSRGDTQALRVFYQRQSPGIYALCLRILNNPHDAEDVMVDVFQEYWQRLAGYDASRGSPIGLLVTLARSRAIDRRRARVRFRAATLDEPAIAAEAAMLQVVQPPDKRLEDEQQRSVVKRALRTLSDDQRRAIEAAYYDGLSHSEIAAALQKPLGTVKTYIRQGLLRMKNSLAEFESAT